jgi:hypothetical protein
MSCQGYQSTLAAGGDQAGQDAAVTLVEPKDHMLAGGTPAPFTRCLAAELGLIHLDLSGVGTELLEALLIDHLPENAEPALHRVLVDGNLEAQSIGRYAQAEEHQKAAFPVRRDASGVPQCLVEFPRQATAAASLLARRELPEFSTTAARARFHGRILMDLS